jgi:hypothetical protein
VVHDAGCSLNNPSQERNMKLKKKKHYFQDKNDEQKEYFYEFQA